MLGTVQFSLVFYSPSPPPSNRRLFEASLMGLPMARMHVDMVPRRLSETAPPSNTTAGGSSAPNLTEITIRAAIIEMLDESPQLSGDFGESYVDVEWLAAESTARVTVQETSQDGASKLQRVVNNSTFLGKLATELKWPAEGVEFEQTPVVAYVIVRAPKSPPSPPKSPPNSPLNSPSVDTGGDLLGIDDQSDALTRTAEAATGLPTWLLGVIGFVLLVAVGVGGASVCLCCKRRGRDSSLLSPKNRKVGLASARFSSRKVDEEKLTEERLRVRSERLRDLASSDQMSICKCANGRSTKGGTGKPEQAEASLLGSQQRSHWKTGLLAMRGAKALHHTWSAPAPEPPKQASRAGSAALQRARSNRKQQSDSSLRKQLSRQLTSGKLRTTPTDSSSIHFVHDGPGGNKVQSPGNHGQPSPAYLGWLGLDPGSTKVHSPRHQGRMMGGVMLGGEEPNCEQKPASAARVTFKAQACEGAKSRHSDMYPQVGDQGARHSSRKCGFESRPSSREAGDRRLSAADRRAALAMGGHDQLRSSKRAAGSTKRPGVSRQGTTILPGIDGGGCLCSMKL